ncbi:MAG: 16S rRNA (uracil(1498)-N(3))-methyltransferase [Paludibacteraceae bacterium]|nr:16S rRNA (uracil(1498)-N(3))-methyltransferase [Paludibacteraceae bacterium]MBR5823321.1 16S rRNA (uracil(1498)-N(3))-methyltransferase [Paludibacteraceae bacterium]
MNLFYAPDILQTLSLPEEESQHCAKVLRMKAGEHIHIIDGVGGLYEAEILEAHPKRTQVSIISEQHEYGRRPFRLHLAVAPTKNIDRFEWFVEKATEIGFDELTPLCCRYSERKVIKPERIEKILVSAAKQSLKAYVPRLNPMITAKEFIGNSSFLIPHSSLFIAHCYDQPKQHLFNACQPGGDVVVMVGPEGDFSEEEVELALRNSFQAITLGESRLRTETAGVVACHLVTVANLKK